MGCLAPPAGATACRRATSQNPSAEPGVLRNHQLFRQILDKLIRASHYPQADYTALCKHGTSGSTIDTDNHDPVVLGKPERPSNVRLPERPIDDTSTHPSQLNTMSIFRSSKQTYPSYKNS